MAGKILFPDETVIRTGLFSVHQDREDPIPGFFIIEPLRKVRSVAEFTDEESEEFMRLLRELRRGMRTTLGVEDVYLFQNEDTEHDFHLWIFPRLAWMEKFGRGIGSVRPIMDHAKREMARDDVTDEVKGWVRRMREYMRSPGTGFDDSRDKPK